MAGRDSRSRKGAIREKARRVYREAILEAAERVFARDGLPGTRISDIAGEAGLAAGTLYNYFDSKEQILASLVEHRLREYSGRVDERCAAVADPRERLAEYVRVTFEFLDEHSAMYAAFVDIGGGSPSGLRRIGGEGAAALHDEHILRMERMVSDAVDAGVLRDDVGVEALVAFFSGTISGMLLAWVDDTSGRPVDDYIQLVVELFSSGAKS